MLKVVLNHKTEPSVIMGSGDLADIASEMSYVIASLYTQLKNNNPQAAEQFREMIVRIVTSPDTPLWAGDAKAGFAMMAVHPNDGEG